MHIYIHRLKTVRALEIRHPLYSDLILRGSHRFQYLLPNNPHYFAVNYFLATFLAKLFLIEYVGYKRTYF